MNKKILALVIVLVVVLVGAGVAYRSLTTDTGTQIKQSQEAASSQGGTSSGWLLTAAFAQRLR